MIYVGSSNFAGWHIAAAQERPRRRHFLGLVSEQCIYNLMTRAVELEVIPAAQHYGLGLIPWSPLQGGLLSGAIRKLESGDAKRTERRPGRQTARREPAGGRGVREAVRRPRRGPGERGTARGCCPGPA